MPPSWCGPAATWTSATHPIRPRKCRCSRKGIDSSATSRHGTESGSAGRRAIRVAGRQHRGVCEHRSRGQYRTDTNTKSGEASPNASNPNQINFNTLLFDPITVNGTSVPTTCGPQDDQHFTLDTWAGTGPSLVNNALTLGTSHRSRDSRSAAAASARGAMWDTRCISLSARRTNYGFLTSSVGRVDEVEHEISTERRRGGASASGPQPTTLALLGLGLVGIRASRRRRGTIAGSTRP